MTKNNHLNHVNLYPLVSGNKFWGYSPLLNQTVEDYSGDMAAWRMTENVTAALPWTNGIYFFAGDKYYTYYTRLTNVKVTFSTYT